jgi:alginate O-acetyltransferase complex protein AlgI
MLFSSLVFLFLFLPLCLLAYYLSPRALKNYTLLFASLVFFAWGGVSVTALLLASITANYFFGLLIGRYRESNSGYAWLQAGVAFNLVLLGTYKYADFIIANLNIPLEYFDFGSLPLPHILLPVGISFYTFHSISYIVDIYRGKTPAQRNPFHLALYISMFSQLIAGPIIRYNDVWKQLTQRVHTPEKFASGVERFILGLSRKVLLANTFARVADQAFDADPTGLGAINAWLGVVCYALQLYHDFAGYSDMAIGLGRMFGFDFMENFNFPYLATSIRSFWQRWHISLSTFFRDYVYIPMGGNQLGARRTYLNLIAVFFLTGFWHGASWNFIVFGLLHGSFMIAERMGLEKAIQRAGIGRLYVAVAALIAWIPFRAPDLAHTVIYWRSLFHFHHTEQQMGWFMSSFDKEFILAMVVGLLACTPIFRLLAQRVSSFMAGTISLTRHFTSAGIVAVWLVLLFLCTLYLIAGSYNPFIYYRF